MRKKNKVLLLVSIVVLSMFLFVQPIKAETEIIGINPTDDKEIQGLWDIDGFFIEGLNYTNWNASSFIVGWDGITAEQLPREHRAYLKFDVPSKPNKTIFSMKLRLRVISDFGDEGRNYNMTTNLVANNWNEKTLHWDNVPDDMGKSVEWTIYPEYYGGEYIYINLTSFIDYIENNTLSINIIMESLLEAWIKYYIRFVSKDAEEYKPTLIVEYEDVRPPQPFTLMTNAGNPDVDGIFILQWTDSERVNDYSIYQNDTLIESGLTAQIYPMDISINGTFSFKVVAFNEYGNMSSNEILVNITIPPPSPFILTSNSGNPFSWAINMQIFEIKLSTK